MDAFGNVSLDEESGVGTELEEKKSSTSSRENSFNNDKNNNKSSSSRENSFNTDKSNNKSSRENSFNTNNNNNNSSSSRENSLTKEVVGESGGLDEQEEEEDSGDDQDDKPKFDEDPYLDRFRVNFEHVSHGHDSQHHNYTVSIRTAKIIKKKTNNKPSHVVYHLHSKFEPHTDSLNSPPSLSSSPSSSSSDLNNSSSSSQEVTYKVSRRWEDFVWLRDYLADYFSTLEDVKQQALEDEAAAKKSKSGDSSMSSSPSGPQSAAAGAGGLTTSGKVVRTEYHRHFGTVEDEVSVPLPTLPAISWKNYFGFGEFDQETIETRKRGLNKFMQQLSFHPVVGRHVLFKKFITEKSMVKVIEYFAL